MKILVAEDDSTGALILERGLASPGREIAVVGDGAAALAAIRGGGFDVLVTDWMMPGVDGIELIRTLRQTVAHPPVVIMVSALGDPASVQYALDSGADDFLAKPYRLNQLRDVFDAAVARRAQPLPAPRQIPRRPLGGGTMLSAPRPPFVAIVVGASTGGPQAIGEFLAGLPGGLGAAVYIAQHGPAWMLQSFAERLGRSLHWPVSLAVDGRVSRPGTVYLAPGERHLRIAPENWATRLGREPPINFVRPAADPLFVSVAAAFGPFAVGVVLSGMGRDAAHGAQVLRDAGGVVLVQSPETCTIGGMPGSVIDVGAASEVVALSDLPARATHFARSRAARLAVHPRRERRRGVAGRA